jgi:hypothetical protein
MAIGTLAASLNKRIRKLPQPATWLFQFTPGGFYNISYDGQMWSVSSGESKNPDLIVTTSPEWWATFLAVERKERAKMAKTLQVFGASERVNEFLQTLGVSSETAQAH